MNDLAKLGDDALGEVFIKDGEPWVCIGYTDQPTVTMRRVRGGERGIYVLNAPIAKPFKHIEMPEEMRDWFLRIAPIE